MSGSAAVALLCVIAGFAGSIQVAVMARLGDRVGIAEALAFATVLSAALATLILLVLRGSLDGFTASARQPAWLWLGAVMSLFILFTITLAGARIGPAATIGIIIAGAAPGSGHAWVAAVAWLAIVLVNWLYYRRP